MITARQGCTSNETRMAVAASVNLLFSANALKPSGPDRSHIFASRIIPTIVSLPTSAPLLIAITLQVDTDNGMYTIPTVANDRGPSSALNCVPLVDGLPAGLARGLSSNAEAVGRASAGGMYNPRTEGFEQVSPGNFPDTQWSILREYHVASDGRHQVALECEAGAAFQFRGLAMLTVMQQASGD